MEFISDIPSLPPASALSTDDPSLNIQADQSQPLDSSNTHLGTFAQTAENSNPNASEPVQTAENSNANASEPVQTAGNSDANASEPVQTLDNTNPNAFELVQTAENSNPNASEPVQTPENTNPNASEPAQASIVEPSNIKSAVSFVVTKEDSGNLNVCFESQAKELLTFETLVELCTSNPTVQSAHFTLGLPLSRERFNFHQAIHLSHLTKLSLTLPKVTRMSRKELAIPVEFKRLLYFLKQIQFENLQTIEINCTTEQAACIPLATAFVPCYELADYSPLADLICRNRKTLKHLILGKSPHHQVQITLNPRECNAMCEPKYYPKIETFIGIPNFPVLESWSVMIRPQRHLKRVSMAFVDVEVWNNVCEGIENSSDTVTSVNFMAFGVKSVPLDLIYFKRCISLNAFTLRYFGFTVIGWEYMPGGIKHLHLGGKVSEEDVAKIITALPLLEDISIELKKNYFGDVDSITTESKLDIMKFPTFEFVKQAEEKLRNIYEIRFESDPDKEFNSLPITEWVGQQSYFTLNSTSLHEISLSKVLKEKDEGDLFYEADNAGAINEFFGSCFGGMFVYA